ncbi:MAG: acyl-CoA dehydrogenase family protein [Polyangiaceae bacterium]
MNALLEHLLSSSPAPRFDSTVDQAASAGFMADRLGHAFAGGYRAALARLIPGLTSRACLCATEHGGAHPKFIRTTLTATDGGWRLTGKKTWVTLGTEAEELLVIATTGTDAQGRNMLRLARVPANRAGVTLVEKEATPFAPEIPHAEAMFDSVVLSAEEILAGDGYELYLKPFRTIEDTHVLAATLGYLLSVARRGAWPHAFVEQTLCVLLSLRELGAGDPARRETHLALSGVFQVARRILGEADVHWTSADPEERARWERDRVLLEVAEKARTLRTEAAWARPR